ncbi:hypothetical protein [Pseudonocardia sp. GCM10023141]|uniref:hypothetical protein n=1 Tax=Pseudonocardia sp. GCM10023141 TaxID=3252653 RepID=UPI003608E19B
MIPLRPLQLGDIYSGAFRNIRMNPAATLGVAFVVITIVAVIQVIIQLVAPRPTSVRPTDVAAVLSASLTSLAVSLVGSIITVLAVSVASGLLVVVLSRAVLGRPTTFPQAWSMVKARIAGLVGVSLLVGLIAIVIAVVGIGVGLLLLFVGGSNGFTILLAVLLFIATVVAVIYLAVSLSLATAAYVLEHAGVVAALRRSRELVQGSWWRIFGIVILTGIIVGIIGFVIALPFGLGGATVAISAGVTSGVSVPALSTSAVILSGIASIISGTLTMPFSSGVTNLLYVDQRIRKERFDVDLARAAAEGREPGQLS